MLWVPVEQALTTMHPSSLESSLRAVPARKFLPDPSRNVRNFRRREGCNAKAKAPKIPRGLKILDAVRQTLDDDRSRARFVKQPWRIVSRNQRPRGSLRASALNTVCQTLSATGRRLPIPIVPAKRALSTTFTLWREKQVPHRAFGPIRNDSGN